MEISDELKQRVIDACEAHRPHLTRLVKNGRFEHHFVIFPIIIDGVYDMIRYNVAEKRFDQVEIQIATGDVSMLDWNEDVGYSSHTETVIIPLSMPVME